MRTPVLLIIPLLLFSCNWKKTADVADDIKDMLEAGKTDPAIEKKFEEKKFTGERKFYYEGGALKTVIRYKDGKREGMSANYYESGGVCVETEYKKGKKDGRYTWYFENGKPFRLITYKNDVKTGPYIEYNHSGKPKFETSYHNDQPCAGLKEYDLYGKPLAPLTLEVIDKGYNLNTGIYKHVFRFNRKVKEARYYVGETADNCFNLDKVEVAAITGDNNEAVLEIPLPRGQYIMKKVTFIGWATTLNGAETIAIKNYNFSIEGR